MCKTPVTFGEELLWYMGFYDLAQNENNCFHPVVIPLSSIVLASNCAGIVIKATVKTKIKIWSDICNSYREQK
jgi:hypothetical protein